MIMQVPPNGGEDREPRPIFPAGEGRTETLGINFPPSIAAAIRRTGFRRGSISDELLNLIDGDKLRRLLREDREHQTKCDSQSFTRARK